MAHQTITIDDSLIIMKRLYWADSSNNWQSN